MKVKPGYKRTEIGEIPEDWDVVQLKDIGSTKNGINKPKEAFGHGHPFVNLMDVFGVPKISTTRHLGLLKTSEKDRAIYDLKAGDVLFVRSSVKPSGVGLPTLVSEPLKDTVFSGFLLRFRDNGVLLQAYKEFCFQEIGFRKSLIENSTVSANTNINQFSLKNLYIPVPRLRAEQKVIAEALSDVDASIAALSRLIAKKRDIRVSATQQLLTGQIRLPGFTAPWKERQLCDLADTDPENLGSDTNPNLTFNYIALENVDRGRLKGCSNLRFVSAPSRARRRLRDRDVLFATVRPNLQAHLLFTESANQDVWVCSTGFCVLRCKKGVADPAFVFAQLFGSSITRQVEKLIAGSNYPAVNSGDIRALWLSTPEPDEQAAIAEILSDMDKGIASLERRLDKTRAIKQAMMQALLTGRVRLPVKRDPIPESNEAVHG